MRGAGAPGTFFEGVGWGWVWEGGAGGDTKQGGPVEVEWDENPRSQRPSQGGLALVRGNVRTVYGGKKRVDSSRFVGTTTILGPDSRASPTSRCLGPVRVSALGCGRAAHAQWPTRLRGRYPAPTRPRPGAAPLASRWPTGRSPAPRRTTTSGGRARRGWLGPLGTLAAPPRAALSPRPRSATTPALWSAGPSWRLRWRARRLPFSAITTARCGLPHGLLSLWRAHARRPARRHADAHR